MKVHILRFVVEEQIADFSQEPIFQSGGRAYKIHTLEYHNVSEERARAHIDAVFHGRGMVRRVEDENGQEV